MASFIRPANKLKTAFELGRCDKGNFAVSEQSISLLQSLPVFGGINSSVIELILKLSPIIRKKPGEFFFKEDDPGTSTYIMLNGNAAVIKSLGQVERLIRHVKEGDCFGEMAVIDHLPRSASVMAEVEACAIKISTSVLLEVYKQDLEQFTMIQMNMGREVSRRLREASDLLFEYQSDQYPFLNLQ